MATNRPEKIIQQSMSEETSRVELGETKVNLKKRCFKTAIIKTGARNIGIEDGCTVKQEYDPVNEEIILSVEK